MILYVAATTNVVDLIIDYIEVKLNTGQTVSLNWDESDIERLENGFYARYKGVYFDEDYANGRIRELYGMQVVEMGLYSDSYKACKCNISLDEIEVYDDSEELSFSEAYSNSEHFIENG